LAIHQKLRGKDILLQKSPMQNPLAHLNIDSVDVANISLHHRWDAASKILIVYSINPLSILYLIKPTGRE